MTAAAVSLVAAGVCAMPPAYAAGPGDFAAGFLDFFEYKMDVDAAELFPSEQVRDDLISQGEPRRFEIGKVEREIAGFKVSVQDITVELQPSRLDSTSTRIDVDIWGRSVEIGGSLINKTFNDINVEGIYGIYNAETDKVTIHVPFAVALSLLFN